VTSRIEAEQGTAKSKAAIQTVLGGPVQSADLLPVEHIITSMELESGVSSAETRDNNDLLVAEFYLSTLSGKIPWGGAVPDMSKLAASTQQDTRGLWWGWRLAGNLRTCDLCIYEAGYFYREVYYCRPHWNLFEFQNAKILEQSEP